MTANSTVCSNSLVDAAVSWLRERLPDDWEIAPTQRAEFHGPAAGRTDAALDLRGPNGVYATVAVEAKQTFGPKDIDRLLGGMGRVLRTLAGNVAILIVAPWLSPRTQQLLRAEGINYLDLTGNALLRLDNPTLFLQTEGAGKDPSPVPRGTARVQGPKAGRLVRTLADVRPPYGVRDLAAAIGLTPGYVSRLLDALDEQALVRRSPRGAVAWVDVTGLLRRWADSYDVLRSNQASTYLAPAGAAKTVAALEALDQRTAVTGSFAAVRLAAVAAPAMLVAYCDRPADAADNLGLIPADQGANVVLLRPFDPVVWQRTSREPAATYVAPSQVAVDCLTGNGRMPAEGDALLAWMTDNEDSWRLTALPTVASLEWQ